jgi:hypothetical protein
MTGALERLDRMFAYRDSEKGRRAAGADPSP